MAQHFLMSAAARTLSLVDLCDQRRDVGVSLRDRSEHLPPSACGFNISDTDLQVPFPLFATTDERRIHADGDRCCCRSCRLVRGRSSKLRADPQRMAGAMSQGSCRHRWATGVAGRQRRRDSSSGRKGEPAARSSSGVDRHRDGQQTPSLGAIAGNAQKPGKPHRHFAEQRRDAVPPPILQVASSAAGPATWPQLTMAVDLTGNDRSLNARQKLLRFGQGQTQVRDIAKTFRPTDFYQIGAQATRVIPGRNQPQHPSHPRSPSRLSTARSYLPCRHPPICGRPPPRKGFVQRFDQIVASICPACECART